ncbi:MAG: putative peptidoglycan glycosyltransferase FtsW [Candidatus Algichlamydia australiensis]|nr:putative peptidoglycan glycosyltransferase FtsW [Chlamydiales bacterium]
MNRSWLFGITLALFFIGLVLIYNTTSAEVIDRELALSPFNATIKQFLYAIFALFVCGGIWFVGYERLIDLSPKLMTYTVIFLLLVFFPGIGMKINGARRWIGFGGFSFQPSELAKGVIPLYFIFLTTSEEKFGLNAFVHFLFRISLPLFLILIEPDNGTTALILATLCVLFFLSEVKMSWWATPLCFLTLFGALIASQMSHVAARIKIYLHPELDLLGRGHQPYQAKIASGSGGFFGRGLGESLQKLNYLPEARSDYIAAIYAEEFGFVGVVILILLYVAIGYFGFRIAMKAPTKRGFLVAAIVTFLITFQAFINLGVVSALLPSKGMSLPFLSQGGTSLLFNMILMTLLFQVGTEERCAQKSY